MRYQTELMRAILTNETAQKMVGYVSPIYGNSYVALWIFQAVGTILGEVYDLAQAMMTETNPTTATLLLDQWEEHYGIQRGVGMTPEQRRSRILSKMQTKGPCNPATMEAAVSAVLGGVKVEVTENVAKNTFRVNVRESVTDYTPAIAVIERLKPAHLLYELQVATKTVATADIKTAIAVTTADKFTVEVRNQ